MSAMRTTGAVLGGIAVLCFILVQFLPWGGESTQGGTFGGGGFEFTFGGTDVDAYTWHARIQAPGSTDTESWYSDEFEDEDGNTADGVDSIRTAIPLLLGGLLVLGIGVLVQLATRGGAGPIVLTAGAVLLIAATLFFAMGVDALFDSDQEWDWSFFLAVIGSVLALVGGVLSLVAPSGRPTRR